MSVIESVKKQQQQLTSANEYVRIYYIISMLNPTEKSLKNREQTTCIHHVHRNSSLSIQIPNPDDVRCRMAISFNNDLNFGMRSGLLLRRC
jgi:hypothetical protein